MDQRARRWCFTLNNWIEEEKECLKGCGASYIIFGEEIAPTTGTPHLQGYMEYDNAKSKRSVIKDTCCDRISLRPARANQEDNYKYCSKDGKNIYEDGIPKEQGARNDLNEIAEEITNGESLRTIAENHPSQWIRYNKGIASLKTILTKDRTERPKVLWYYGDTGAGKTYKAKQFGDYYIKDGTMWWDGYSNESVIIIDDFDGKWPFRDLLRLLDENKYQGQFKGGYLKINSPTIVITCDRTPQKLYDRVLKPNELAQLLRRIDSIEEITRTKEAKASFSIDKPIESGKKLHSSFYTEVSGNTRAKPYTHKSDGIILLNEKSIPFEKSIENYDKEEFEKMENLIMAEQLIDLNDCDTEINDSDLDESDTCHCNDCQS